MQHSEECWVWDRLHTSGTAGSPIQQGSSLNPVLPPVCGSQGRGEKEEPASGGQGLMRELHLPVCCHRGLASWGYVCSLILIDHLRASY